MSVKKDIEPDENRKDTLPPPPSGDAYSAATVVRDVPPQVLEQIKARRLAEERAKAEASKSAELAPPPPRKTDDLATPVAEAAQAIPLAPSVVFEKDDGDEEVRTALRVKAQPAQQAGEAAAFASPAQPPMAAPAHAPTSATTWRLLALALVLLVIACGLITLGLQDLR